MRSKPLVIFLGTLVLILFTFSATLLAGTPKISVTPASINFGNVKLGGTSGKTITIKNTGTSDLVISNISITGLNASEFGQTNNCTTIPKGGSCPITVTFNPTLLPFGQKSATASISSNDPVKPTVGVKLSGNASPPKISVSPMSINFGSVEMDSTSSPKTVTIKNIGASDLVISDVTITGTDASEFSQTNNCSTVSSGGSCTATAGFAPTLPPGGSKTATMSISSNDPKSPTVSVKLSGTAKGGMPSSSLTVYGSDLVGSLFGCIDDSGSYVIAESLVAVGGSPHPGYTWTLSNLSAYPPGTTVEPPTGIFKWSGGTLLPGQYTFDMTVSDGLTTAQGTFTFEVEDQRNGGLCACPADQLSQSSVNYLPNATAGHAYGATMFVDAGCPKPKYLPLTWSISAGQLPPGLTLDSSRGVIYGVPFSSAAGQTFDFTVHVQNGAGDASDSGDVYSITVE